MSEELYLVLEGHAELAWADHLKELTAKVGSTMEPRLTEIYKQAFKAGWITCAMGMR